MATTSTAATSLDDFNLHGTPYEAECSIGCGAYGTVCRALNLRTQNAVAIKRIPRAFAAATVVKRALREVRILRQLQAENIISVLDMFTVSEDPSSSGRDVYMVLDLMETDLHRIIASEQSLEDDHIRYFTYQLFRGLKYLHSGGIVHRDIKPSNLLINGDCLLRIADFGMARALASNAAVDGEQAAEYVDDSFMTQYVATRWYRAPELLLSLVDYDAKVDIWAAGCVLGEMILRRQLFPGRNVVQQVQMLVHYLGTPDDEVMDRIASELVRSWVEKCGRRQGSGWDRLLPPNTSPDAVQAMERLMVIAPWRRATAVEALQLPFVAKYHNEAYEPSCERRIVLDVDAIERLSPTEMKEALVAEAEHFERARRLSEDDAAVGRLSP